MHIYEVDVDIRAREQYTIPASSPEEAEEIAYRQAEEQFYGYDDITVAPVKEWEPEHESS